MNNLTITKEKVLEAAAKCSTAKETLKTLFPECFEEDKYFDLNSMFPEGLNDRMKGIKSPVDIWIRSSGELNGKAFFLNKNINWNIITDSYGSLCLIPTKK